MTVTRWRVAVTRDEDAAGPLSAALRLEGFTPRLCPVSVERPPADPSELLAAAARLEEFDWVICASARAVRALMAARPRAWPPPVRAAAVGARTAAALAEAGAAMVFTAPEAGAEALWAALAGADHWPQRRVLVPTVSGGRRELIDGLVAAGARVTTVEAYAMVHRPAPDIAETWKAISPESAVIASPSVGVRLVEAVGTRALQDLEAIVAMGATTAQALLALDIHATVPLVTDFPSVARHLTHLWGLRGDV
ncbi:MAG TPA: uroporphyrinogen-III synthase [Vicinamibacterales bacterium]|nr:uroporphyrinogen-III synthase [Vicinamibacterales bacterium]